MTDYSEEQRNELEALESIYPDSFTGEQRRGPSLAAPRGRGEPVWGRDGRPRRGTAAAAPALRGSAGCTAWIFLLTSFLPEAGKSSALNGTLGEVSVRTVAAAAPQCHSGVRPPDADPRSPGWGCWKGDAFGWCCLDKPFTGCNPSCRPGACFLGG